MNNWQQNQLKKQKQLMQQKRLERQKQLEQQKQLMQQKRLERQKQLEQLKQQRDLDLVLINSMNEDETYLPTLQEAELFRNYILEYIDIWGEDDLRENLIPQLLNLYFIDITKEILNDLA